MRRLFSAAITLATRPRDALTALRFVDALLDGVNDSLELRARMKRAAEAGDLEDSVAELMRLKRG